MADPGAEPLLQVEEAAEPELIGRGVVLRPDEGEEAFAK
jgi:hypothetical protein